MERHIRRSALLVAVGAATALGSVACQSDQASVLEPAGSLVFNFPLALTATNMPRGTVKRTVGTPAKDTTKITLTGLQTLKAPSEYQVWLGQTGEAGITWVKAAGAFRRVSVDTTLDQFGDPKGTPTIVDSTNTGVYISSFSVGGPRVIDTLLVTQASLAASGAATTDPAAYDIVLVTIEDDAAAATDPTGSTIRPLWATFSSATAKTATFSFGTFNEDPAKSYVFKATGRGTAGVRDNILIVDDSLLSRPPVGYYYATHLTRITTKAAPDEAGTLDTTAYSLGAQHLPYPHRDQSLENADVTLIPGYVVDNPPTVLYAGVRLNIDTLTTAGTVNQKQPYVNFRQVLVTLESKKGDPAAGPSPNIVLVGTFSDLIAKPKS
jgi:hypothetical protein